MPSHLSSGVRIITMPPKCNSKITSMRKIWIITDYSMQKAASEKYTQGEHMKPTMGSLNSENVNHLSHRETMEKHIYTRHGNAKKKKLHPGHGKNTLQNYMETHEEKTYMVVKIHMSIRQRYEKLHLSIREDNGGITTLHPAQKPSYAKLHPCLAKKYSGRKNHVGLCYTRH